MPLSKQVGTKKSDLVVNHVSQDIPIGSLGPNSAASIEVNVMSEPFRFSRLKGWVAGDALDSDIGPVIFGFADTQLSNAEIDECMSAQPNRWNDSPANERAARPVFPLGAVFKSGGDGQVIDHFDSRDWPFKGMTIPEGDGLKLFAWNADQVSNMGANDSITFYLKLWGVWI